MIPENLQPAFLKWMRDHDDDTASASAWMCSMESAAGVFLRDHRLDNTYERRHKAVFVYIDLCEEVSK